MIIPTTNEDEVIEWLLFYNKYCRKPKGDRKISISDLQTLTSLELIDIDSLRIGYEQGIPKAICRLEFSRDNKSAYLSDLCFSQSTMGTIFIDSVLENVRQKGAQSVITWVPDGDGKVTELLGDFSFEARKVHLLLRNILLYSPDESNYKIESFESPLNAQLPVHSERIICISLRELYGHFELSWDLIAKIGPLTSNNEFLLAYQSRSMKHIGAILFNHPFHDDPDLIVQPLKRLFRLLYDKGVREIQSEIDTDQNLKQAFLTAGFGIDSTLFQLEMDIIH